MNIETSLMNARKPETLPARPRGLRQPPADHDNLADLLATFEPITLAQMEDARLMDRSEAKFLLPRRLLVPVLAELRDAYRVFVPDCGGRPLQPASRYRTLYFDTADLALYLRHHDGAKERYKVRTREYVDSHVAFVEVKHKVGVNRTVKSRMPIVDPAAGLAGEAAAFVTGACPYGAASLGPRLWNYCTRITLVSKVRPERVTLDLALAFTRGDALAVLPGIVVAEVKYQGRRGESEFIRLLRGHHVRRDELQQVLHGGEHALPRGQA